jgi:tetratricopeptide (TPR) repeat protein
MRGKALWILALVALAGLAAGAQAPQPAPQTPATPSNPSNPFPEDTSSVPVVGPQTVQPTQANPFPEDNAKVPVADSQPVASDELAASAALMLPGEDRDPARSPDDAEDDTAAPMEMSSSSLKGLEKLVANDDEDEKKGRHHKQPQPEQKPKSKKDAATDNIQIAGYYLERKNWQAALSRFESAMVLDPENPDIYYGLAQAEQHLGRMASARTHYQMVAEFDPDSKQGKEARRALKDPAIAKGVDPKPVEKPADNQQ